MSKDHGLDWGLINKIANGTATAEEIAKWKALVQQQAAYATLIPWLRRLHIEQQDTTSPFYAIDAWQGFKTKLQTPSMVKQPSRIFRLWKQAGMAAAIALIISVCWWSYPSLNRSAPKKTNALLTYTASNGQHKLITLPDSTKIWMNAGSMIKIPVDWEKDSTREVWLTGESFFEVKENPAQPFIVHADETTIRVLGTSFNIEAYEQHSVAVTVATGKVQFSSNAGQSVTMDKNQRSLWKNGQSVLQTTGTDASFYSAWRQGILQFNDEPLLKVIAAIERKFNIPVKVIGTISENQYCTAKFAAGESLDNILESLRHIYGLTITKKGQTITIQSK